MTTSSTFDISQIIKWSQKTLLKNGISNAKKEIEWYFKKEFNYNRMEKSIQETAMSKHNINKVKQFIKRRINKEPFQYIVGSAPFYDQEFIVSKDVLIPRPETEIIIEVLKKKQQIFKKALDVGTGSGNLAIIISLHNIAETITATDISKPALNIAKKNITKFKTSNIKLIYNNFLKDRVPHKYDLIISNPPYISQKSYERLDETVKKYEPKKALTDSNDGNSFYIVFAQKLKKILYKKGVLLIETGINQNKLNIENIFYKEGFKVLWHKDYNQQNRIAEVKYA